MTITSDIAKDDCSDLYRAVELREPRPATSDARNRQAGTHRRIWRYNSGNERPFAYR